MPVQQFHRHSLWIEGVYYFQSRVPPALAQHHAIRQIGYSLRRKPALSTAIGASTAAQLLIEQR